MKEQFSIGEIIFSSCLLSIPTVVIGVMTLNPLPAVAQIAWLAVIGLAVVNNEQ